MHRVAGLALALLSGFAGAVDTPARIDTIQLDSARSRAEFHVKVLWLIDVTGEFGAVAGTVQVDRFRSQAVVDARIEAGSVHMRRAGTENWVRSAEFFDVARYPEIHFVSAAFPLARLDQGGEVPGTLTLRGISRPVVFELTPATCDRPAFDCPVAAEGSMRRSDFGMRSRRLTLSDRIELSFSIYARAPLENDHPS